MASQCKKGSTDVQPDNPYGLPNATQTGANIFACRINGVNWISGTGITILNGGASNDTLSLTGADGGANYFERLTIQVFGGAIQGSQKQITTTSSTKLFLNTNRTCQGIGSVSTNYAVEGNITLTKIDKTNKIISGTFNCKIPMPNCDTLKITDGRYDIGY
jgi:hypothetical protein